MRGKKKTFNFDFSVLDSRENFKGVEKEVLNAIYGFNLPIKHKTPNSLWDEEQENDPVKIYSKNEIENLMREINGS